MIFETKRFTLNSVEGGEKLNIPLGITEDEKVVFRDLANIPHILISGTTGSGKTSFVRSLLGALMLQNGPEKVNFLIFDSKMVDYGMFNPSAYLIFPVIADQNRVAGALGWLNREVNRRIKKKQEGSSLDEDAEIFLIIDDYSDLSNNKSVNKELFNLLKTGRLVKIHCIILTSTPTAKIISTELKANIPCRIAFSTVSKADSRIILDINGAETLLAPGEMIFKWQNELLKCRCLYVSEADMQIILNRQTVKEPVEDFNVFGQQAEKLLTGVSVDEELSENDPLFKDAIDVVIEAGFASTSLLQRKLKLGYARATRIIDEMEERGIVSGREGSTPRKVLIKSNN